MYSVSNICDSKGETLKNYEWATSYSKSSIGQLQICRVSVTVHFFFFSILSLESIEKCTSTYVNKINKIFINIFLNISDEYCEWCRLNSHLIVKICSGQESSNINTLGKNKNSKIIYQFLLLFCLSNSSKSPTSEFSNDINSALYLVYA